MRRFVIFALMHCFLLVCHASNDSIQEAITRQLQEFPQSHLQDIYKSFYQSCFGAEHLIADTASVCAYLREEIATATTDTVANPYYEPTGANGNFVRVYLRCVTENYITEQQLSDAFLRSAHPQQHMEQWHELWVEKIVPTARKAGLVFSQEELDELTSASRQDRAVRHSDGYRNAYHPHYRIVERRIFETEIKPHIPF